ncbi:MAG: carbohydrate ABC transporter permease [Candidatus Omnitrophica bacterium]|nr:carbohydrate ABC transporter permease [Candidatus Omnitrophota bacterium]
MNGPATLIQRRLSFLALCLITGLALIPLVLMFYTSLKPTGTLRRSVSSLVLADFESNQQGTHKSRMNPGPGAKVQQKLLEEDSSAYLGQHLSLDYRIPEASGFTWQLPLHQDMRKFSILEFAIRVEGTLGAMHLGLSDGKNSLLDIDLTPYISPSPVSGWNQVSLPISKLAIGRLRPGLTEKIAEELALKVVGPGEGSLHIDEVQLRLKRWTLLNYRDVLFSGPFDRYAINSIVIALAVTGSNLLFSAMVGYAFARKRFPGKRTLLLMVLAGIMIPPQVLMVPIFILMKQLGWLNTYWALIVPAAVSPFNIFLMTQYIRSLPSGLEDAARIDGANDFQIFFKLILPLSTPALAVVGINTFMGSWNTFLYPFLLTNTVEMRTLPVGLALYKSLQGADWVHLMAGSSITALPVILIFFMFQRHIIAGMLTSTRGSHPGTVTGYYLRRRLWSWMRGNKTRGAKLSS